MMDKSVEPLEKMLGYSFANKSLLHLALTHKSFSNEHHCASNERMEFLGDAILQWQVSQILFDRYPDLDEGALSKFRSALVSEDGLMFLADRLQLGGFLKLGNGEDSSGGREKRSLLSDAVEAVVAACYLDCLEVRSPEKLEGVILLLFEPEIKAAESKFDSIDHKTSLQERVQRHHLGEIKYKVLAECGPDHKKEFKIALLVQGKEIGLAWGSSKKRAEQNAAILGLRYLKGNS